MKLPKHKIKEVSFYYTQVSCAIVRLATTSLTRNCWRCAAVSFELLPWDCLRRLLPLFNKRNNMSSYGKYSTQPLFGAAFSAFNGFIAFLSRPSQIMCWLNAGMAACQHARKTVTVRGAPISRENLESPTVAQLHKALGSRLCSKLHFAYFTFISISV